METTRRLSIPSDASGPAQTGAEPPARPGVEPPARPGATHSLQRKEFLKVAVAGSLLLGTGGFRWPRDSLDLAIAAGAWLRAVARETPRGLTWPVAPSQSRDDVYHLYSGTPGIILFLLELHHATGETAYLREAEAGARHLLAEAGEGPSEKLPDWGLYTGMSGVAYTLAEVHAAGGDESLGAGAREMLGRILEAARPLDGGLAWFADDPRATSYDVISGSAGIGLTLLHFHELEEGGNASSPNRAEGDAPEVPGVGDGSAPGSVDGREAVGSPLAGRALEVARGAGRLLAQRGRPEHDGLKWPMSEAYPRLMPNFSHGTAGVAYFLARLHEVTGDDAFLAPAISGGRYLERVSVCGPHSDCLIFHHEPGGEALYYLGWCHGPVGTARLFAQLARVTGNTGKWMRWVGQGARGIRAQGIPETRTEGFWNNVSQCCGDAGVGDFFLSLHASGADGEALAFARRLADYLRDEATEEGGRARWIQAENRTQPGNVVAQTGWMQGAAGVGAFLLHLDGAEKGRPARVVFPDSPWRGFI